MRIAIACLALMLMAGPVMACSSAGQRPDPRKPRQTISEIIANDDSVFFGKVIELTTTEVVFKVISSRGMYAPSQVIRLHRHISVGLCDYPFSYNLGDTFIHSGRGEDAKYVRTTISDLGQDSGQNFEDLIKRLDVQTLPSYTRPPTRIISPPLFKEGTYAFNQSCSENKPNRADEDFGYMLSVSPRFGINEHRINIELNACNSAQSCTFNEIAEQYGDGKIIVTPIGQTACNLTLIQTAEGVTVRENDRTACSAALNCYLPNGFNTSAPLQPTADTLRIRHEMNNRVRGNNSFMPTPLPQPQPKAD